MCMGGGSVTLRKSQAEKDLENYRPKDYGPLPDLRTDSSYEFVEPEYRMSGSAPRSLLLPVRRN